MQLLYGSSDKPHHLVVATHCVHKYFQFHDISWSPFRGFPDRGIRASLGDDVDFSPLGYTDSGTHDTCEAGKMR